jgi:hypothetical protein
VSNESDIAARGTFIFFLPLLLRAGSFFTSSTNYNAEKSDTQ